MGIATTRTSVQTWYVNARGWIMQPSSSPFETRVVVLAVDPDIRQGMLEMLRDERTQCRSVSTPTEATEVCTAERPHVLCVAGIESVEEIMRLLADLEARLGPEKPRVSLVFGLRSAGARFLPGVTYSLFAPASGARMRDFIRESIRVREREARHSGVRMVRVSESETPVAAEAETGTKPR